MGKLEIENVIKSCERRRPPVRLKIDGNREIIRKTKGLPYVIGELVNNCLDQRAQTITLEIHDKSFTVSDDVYHPDAEKLLSNLNTPYPVTTKKPTFYSDWDTPVGGIGIQQSRINLSNLKGSLSYRATSDGRIIADVIWE